MTAKRAAAILCTSDPERSRPARLPTNAAMAATDQRAAVAPTKTATGAA